MCSLDADTNIVKAFLQIEEASALLFPDNPDNLCLLIHYVDTSQKQHDIYIKNMTRNANNERVCYRMHGVIDNLDRVIVNFILFAHHFTACDSTPAIHKLGS